MIVDVTATRLVGCEKQSDSGVYLLKHVELKFAWMNIQRSNIRH